VDDEETARRVLTVVGSVALLTWLSTGVTSEAQTRAWTTRTGEVRVTCPLTVGGTFEARTTALQGTLSVTPAASVLGGELSVELKTLDTGISLRNRHMLDNYLEVQESEAFETAVLSNIDVGALTADVPEGKRRFTARLRLHGTTHPVEGQATLSKRESSVRVEASFPIRISDYGIADPRYLGIGVRNEVSVHVIFVANAAS